MNYASLLQDDYSKPTILRIADDIGDNAGRFGRLMKLMMGSDALLAQRSAWAVSYCLEAYPQLGSAYLPAMLDRLGEKVHDAVRRCIFRSLTHMELPEDLHGRIVDVSFKYLMDRHEPIAIRVYAMTIIHQLSKTWPDIRQELISYLEEEAEYGSAGFRSRARKIMRNEI